MATHTKVLTLQDLHNVEPTVRLRLEKKSDTMASLKPKQEGMVDKFKIFVKNTFGKSEGDIPLEHETTEEARKRNLKKIDGFFDNMEKDIEQQRKEAKEEIMTMPPDQQEQVVMFWGAVSEFMNDVLNWLKKVFNWVVAKIREGYRIVKDALTEFFGAIGDWFKKVF